MIRSVEFEVENQTRTFAGVRTDWLVVRIPIRHGLADSPPAFEPGLAVLRQLFPLLPPSVQARVREQVALGAEPPNPWEQLSRARDLLRQAMECLRSALQEVERA